MEHYVGRTEQVPDRQALIVEIDGKSVGVFKIGDRLYAVRNVCPHKQAPLCRGTVGGTMLPSRPGELEFGLEDRVLKCPWHGWEFDLETGQCLFGVSGRRVKTYPVRADEGHIYVETA